jgi:hypothetical protein
VAPTTPVTVSASVTFPELERAATALHEKEAAQAAQLWLDGLNLMLRGFDAFHGGRVEADWRDTMLGLLVGAWNSIHCARDLALRGYPLQSLNLLRLPLEYWIGFWYIRNFPDEHQRFIGRPQPGDHPPDFSEMLKRLRKLHKRRGTDEQDWMKTLHSFSHIDPRNVRTLFESGDGVTNLSLGPKGNREFFEVCAMQGMNCLTVHHEALDVLRRLVSHPPLEGRQGYHGRVREWIDVQVAHAKPYGPALGTHFEAAR